METEPVEIAPEDLKDRFQEMLLATLPIVVRGFVAVYLVITSLHFVVLPPDQKMILVPLAGLTTFYGLAVMAALFREKLGPRHVVAVMSVLCMLLVLNSVVHLYIDGNPRLTTNLLLVAVAIGFAAPILPVVAVANTAMATGLVVTILARPLVPGDEWIHYGIALIFATLLSHTCCAMRAGWMKRLIESQFAQECVQNQLRVANDEIRERAMATQEALARELEANEVKSQFLAMISHEIRTPLNGIVAMAELLSERDKDQSELKKIDVIRKSSDVLLNVINDVLDMSKIEAGKVEIERVEFDLVSELEALEIVFQSQAEEKGLGFSMDIGAQIPVRVAGDPLRLRQILNNLLNNALKFTSEGEIGLVVEATRKDDGRGEVRFLVRDTGIGMTAEEVSRLFRPFVQSDASISRKYGGTGLGLSVSKELALLMSGTINVASTPGAGSTFTLTLPLEVLEWEDRATVRTTSATGEAVTAQKDHSGHTRILVAEDNLTNKFVVESILASQGFEATYVMNGEEAVERARQEVFDVIFMDIQMPVMDGLTATDIIRQEGSASRNATIFALSANAGPDDRRKSEEHKMDGHIAKPVRPKELLEAIRCASG